MSLRSDPRRHGDLEFGRVLSTRQPYNAPVRTFFDMEGSTMILEMDEQKRQLLLLLVSSRISELHSEIRRCQVFNASECLKSDLHILAGNPGTAQESGSARSRVTPYDTRPDPRASLGTRHAGEAQEASPVGVRSEYEQRKVLERTGTGRSTWATRTSVAWQTSRSSWGI